MGLDAHVRCNCAREGKTRPLPFTGRLFFDDCGELFLVDETGVASNDLATLMEFDRWESNPGCEHGRFLVDERIGNIAYVGYIRDWVKASEVRLGRRLPILLEKVVYSGSHSGDCLNTVDVQLLSAELKELETQQQDPDHQEFVRTMQRLSDAALATGNPIVF